MTMVHASRRKRGRPALSTADTKQLTVRLPEPVLDELAREANRRDTSIAEVVRTQLASAFPSRKIAGGPIGW